jgi:GNAT superfamily N-acetyltransferase
MTLRPARSSADWEAVRRLCGETGAGGDPIDPGRWPFFAELWIGPYQRLLPEWTSVAELDGRVVAYLTGCPDSPAFRRRRALCHAVPLLAAVLAGRHGSSPDTRRFVRQAFGREHGAEARLRRRLPRHFERTYPAHFHVNVSAAVRGQGLGRALVERFLGSLREHAVAGVHLFCGAAVRGFYRRLGFAELGALEVRPGLTVHALGRPAADRGTTA